MRCRRIIRATWLATVGGCYTELVIRRWLRAVAASVVLALTSLPIAALVCAHECNPRYEQTGTPTGEHSAPCHEPATGSTSIVPKVDGVCVPGRLAAIAARDRTTTVIDAASAAAAPASLTLVAASKAFGSHLSSYGRRLSGTPPGAVLPLRI